MVFIKTFGEGSSRQLTPLSLGIMMGTEKVGIIKNSQGCLQNSLHFHAIMKKIFL